jgi:hypothetical protein
LNREKGMKNRQTTVLVMTFAYSLLFIYFKFLFIGAGMACTAKTLTENSKQIFPEMKLRSLAAK